MIKVYATTKDGEGYVELIAELESIEEYQIRIGMYAPDVVISFSNEVK